MSEPKPIYSKNPILDGIEHIGHGLHVAEHAVIGATIHTVHDVLVIADDFKKQMPTVLDETGAVIAAAAAPELLDVDATLGAMLATPVNPLCWWNLLLALLRAAPKIRTLVLAGKTLAATLNTDIKADLKQL